MTALSQPVAVPQREQTMEEILASIRKIIETNEAMAIQAETAQSATVAAPVSPPVDVAAVAPVVHAAAGLPVNGPAQSLTEAVAREVTPLAVAQSVGAVERLVSETPERRVAAAFDDLNLAFMRSKQKPLEEVAEAMLRPMLQDWLDNNLPSMVERLVREEIARIARGDI